MIDNSQIKKEINTDIVVIGGGGGGLSAAMAAIEKGAIVALLEKRNLGGNSAHAIGLFASESPVQKRAKIDCGKELCFKMAVDWSHWRINLQVMKAFINKSGDTIKWLEEKGIFFKCHPNNPNQLPIWHVIDGTGIHIIRSLSKIIRKEKASIFTQTTVTNIDIPDENQMVEVTAISPEGQILISAKAVIIATGGFAGNKRLLKKYCPDYQDNIKFAGTGNTGDGLLLAQKLGASLEGAGRLILFGPSIFLSDSSLLLKLGTHPDTISVPLMSIALEPDTLWINKLGKRFADESISFNLGVSANVAVRQPDNTVYTIFDSNLVQRLVQRGLILESSRYKDNRGKRLIGLENELISQSKKGRVKMACSWEELAYKVKVDAEELIRTVAEYNSFSRDGFDGDFNKDSTYLVPLITPPFYAIESHVESHGTIGGIKVNEKMEVIDIRNNPIPGVYAVGADTGGWDTVFWGGEFPGHALSFAINSGRIAGESAAEFVLNN